MNNDFWLNPWQGSKPKTFRRPPTPKSPSSTTQATTVAAAAVAAIALVAVVVSLIVIGVAMRRVSNANAEIAALKVSVNSAMGTLGVNATQIADEVDVLEQATLYEAGTEVIAYVSANGTGSASCSISDHCTLDRAIQVIGMYKVTTCIVQVVGTIDLGDEPHTCFFPVMERCKHMIIRGDRTDVVSTIGSPSDVFGPRDVWPRVSLNTTVTAGLYDQSFMWHNASQKYYVVESNTATLANVVADAADWEVDPTPFTLFTLGSSIEFTGRWTLDIPFGIVRFETIHLDPQDDTAQFAALSPVTHRVAFHGCRLGCGSADSYQGPFIAQGCHVPQAVASANFFQPDAVQSVSLESLYVEDADLFFRGPSKARDILLENNQLRVYGNSALFRNVLMQNADAPEGFALDESANAELINVDVTAAGTGISVFGACTCVLRDVTVVGGSIGVLVKSGSSVSIKDAFSVSSPQPIIANSRSALDLQATATITRTTGGAPAIRIDSNANLFLLAVPAFPVVFTQATGECIRVERGADAFIDATPANAITISTDGTFLAMSQMASVYTAGSSPLNLGGATLLSLCNSGSQSYFGVLTAIPNCRYTKGP